MARWTPVLVAFVLIFAIVHAEEDAGGEGDVSAPSGTLAGYQPASDVEQHARIDLDIKEIEDNIYADPADYTEAKGIYENGKNSASGSGLRTLQSMSTSYLTGNQDEYMARLANAFWGRWDYADKHLQAAFDGVNDAEFGNYNNGVLGASEAARNQVIKKTIKFQLLTQYAAHEYEAGLKKYMDSSLTTADRYGVGGAVHAFDEWWAFYTGSLESGDGPYDGYGPYTLPEKRGPNFGTADCTIGNGGSSCVNKRLLDASNELKTLFQAPGNGDAIKGGIKCIRALLKVPVIQGCLEYGYQSSVASAEALPVQKAEGWAFCGAALPYLHEVDQTAAAAVKAEMIFTNDANPSWTTIRDAFNAENLNAMGVSCEDVGGYNEFEGVHSKCTDTSGGPNNAEANVNDCEAFVIDAESSASTFHAAMWASVLASLMAAFFAQ